MKVGLWWASRWRNRSVGNGCRGLDVAIVEGKCRLCLREEEGFERV